MEKFSQHIKQYWHIYLTLIVFIASSLIIAYIYRNQINPDGVSYIQVARHYAELELKTAVNGYWAPLLSWLMVPFIWLQFDPLIAFRIINFLLSGLVIGSLLFYLNHNRTVSISDKLLQFTFIGSFSILLASWASATVTPDVLSGVILGVMLVLLYFFQKEGTRRLAILFGASLAFLYFSKSIGLYVSLAVVVVVLTVEFYKNRTIAKNSLVALGVFLGLSAVWVGLISIKYDRLTISTAGEYNFALYGPEHPAHPQTVENSYLPVKYPDAIWGWDDPSYFKLPTWNIFEHWSYYSNYILRTTNEAFSLLITSTPLLFLGLWALFMRKKDRTLQQTGYLLGFSSVLIFGAYSLIYVEPRYLWFILIPLIAFGAVVLRQGVKQPRPLIAVLSIVFIATCFSFVPLLQNGQLLQLKNGDLKFLAKESKKHLPDFAKVATPNKYEYCYFSNTQCLGYYVLNGDIDHDQNLIATMRSQGIEYYIDTYDINQPNLETIFKGISSAQNCFDYNTGKTQVCPRTTLTVYKL